MHQFITFFHYKNDPKRGMFGIIRRETQEAAKQWLIDRMKDQGVEVTADDIFIVKADVDYLNMIRLVKSDGNLLDYGEMAWLQEK